MLSPHIVISSKPFKRETNVINLHDLYCLSFFFVFFTRLTSPAGPRNRDGHETSSETTTSVTCNPFFLRHIACAIFVVLSSITIFILKSNFIMPLILSRFRQLKVSYLCPSIDLVILDIQNIEFAINKYLESNNSFHRPGLYLE